MKRTHFPLALVVLSGAAGCPIEFFGPYAVVDSAEKVFPLAPAGDVTFTIVVDYEPGDTPSAELSFVVFPIEVDEAAVEVTLGADDSDVVAGSLSATDADSLQLNQPLPTCEGRCESIAEARIQRTDVGEEAVDVHVSALARLAPAGDFKQQPSLRDVSLEEQ